MSRWIKLVILLSRSYLRHGDVILAVSRINVNWIAMMVIVVSIILIVILIGARHVVMEWLWRIAERLLWIVLYRRIHGVMVRIQVVAILHNFRFQGEVLMVLVGWI
jgi:hypothetical protein